MGSHLKILAAVGLLGLSTTGIAYGADRPNTQKEASEWPGYNGGYDATRFSPLTQIDGKNVASLQEVARFELPETLSFQCGPVVIGEAMYVTTPSNTYAINARTGE